MQCSWTQKLYHYTTPSWEVIPLPLIKTNLGLNCKFHSNLDISVQKLKKFPTYYKIILQNSCLHLTSFCVVPSAIALQALWYNKNIKIDIKSIHLSEISEKGLNCVGYLLSLKNGMLLVLTWVGWVACSCRWHASMGGVLAWMAWVVC